MLTDIVNYIVSIAENFWYIWIFFMMVLESSFFPFPSEVAMIPAWYLASKGDLSFSFALIVWTFWALVWATINYFLWYFLWENVILKLVKKYGKYFLISEKSYKKAEDYFLKYGWITTFSARFITVVRQLISLPAWVFRMDFTKFFILTWLWAWIWNLILMLIWYFVWENQELIEKYSKYLLIWGIVFVILLILIYLFINKRKNATK